MRPLQIRCRRCRLLVANVGPTPDGVDWEFRTTLEEKARQEFCRELEVDEAHDWFHKRVEGDGFRRMPPSSEEQGLPTGFLAWIVEASIIRFGARASEYTPPCLVAACRCSGRRGIEGLVILDKQALVNRCTKGGSVLANDIAASDPVAAIAQGRDWFDTMVTQVADLEGW